MCLAFSTYVQPEEDKALEEISQPILLEAFKALADYKKANRNEINLKKGDVVEVCYRVLTSATSHVLPADVVAYY